MTDATGSDAGGGGLHYARKKAEPLSWALSDEKEPQGVNLGKCMPGSGDSKCKGPEVAMSVAGSRTTQETSEAGA